MRRSHAGATGAEEYREDKYGSGKLREIELRLGSLREEVVGARPAM